MYRTAPIGVIRISDGLHVKPGTSEWRTYGAWITEGNVPLPMEVPTVPQPTAQEMVERYRQAIQEFLDAKAADRDYDNIQTASLRAALPGSPFHAEGVAYGEWMDACWAAGIVIMNNALNNTIPIPTVQELLDQLPELVLPPNPYR